MEEINKQPPGLQRFKVQLAHLSGCLKSAAASGDPALTLFQSPARQHAFYLQALSRIYRKIHDKTAFNNLRDEFKLLEDHLGKVDFFHAYCVMYASVKDFPPELTDYFNRRMDEALHLLRQLLHEDKWLVFPGKLQLLDDSLEIMEWKPAEEDRKDISGFLEEELDDFDKDYRKDKFDFSLMEEGVHEFRRQLRWFSIYSQALDGLIQLKEDPQRMKALDKYLLPETLSSPYNKLPPAKGQVPSINLSAPDFYAISWVINEIGLIKDEGLRIHALTEGIITTGIKEQANAPAYALTLLDDRIQDPDVLLVSAREIADELIKRHEVIAYIRNSL